MIFKCTKSPSPLSTPSPPLESHPRNPRVHGQSAISSTNGPKGLSGKETNAPRTGRPLNTKAVGGLNLSRDPKVSQTSAPTSHRRVASMPQRYDHKIARGPVSPPIVDLASFDTGYRDPRTAGNFEGLLTKTNQTNESSVSMKQISKRNPTSSGGMKNNHTSDMILDPHPASTRKPDPRLIISALESVILHPLEKPLALLDVYDLLGMHQLDQLDFEERDMARRNSTHTYPREMVVLGEPLRKASIYASTTVVLGGREHELPIIVVTCIEELYRTGIYQSNLFRTLPNRSRLLELISIFDSGQQPPGSIIRPKHSSPLKNPSKSGFGANMSLHLESTPDICALLSTYLSALPEPILLPALFRPIWDWCGLEEDEVNAIQLKPFRRHISSVPLSRTYTNPTESTRIQIAQLVLHLLPSPHFSLLVYILAFFSQVAMVHEENGVGVEDLARMFGGRIFGGGQLSRQRKTSAEIALTDPHEPRMEGEVMMCWFLRRWGPISEGLFDVIEDVKMGIFKDQQAERFRMLEPSEDGFVPSSLGDGEIPNHASGRDTPFKPAFKPAEWDNEVSHSGDDLRSDTHPHDDESPSKIILNPETKCSEERVGDSDKGVAVSKTLANEIVTKAPTTDEESICSATALDERLLDVSMPTLLNQTFPNGPFGNDDSSRYTTELAVNDIDEAHQRILGLEADLDKSRAEVSKEKKRCLELEDRIEGLEKALESEKKKNLIVRDGLDDDDDEGMGRMLEMAKKERDEALKLVCEIRKLMVKN